MNSRNGRITFHVALGLVALGLLCTLDEALGRPLSLTFVAVMGGEGRDLGRMVEPSGVAVDPAGNVYVADTGNHRIQQFDAEGRYVRYLGGFGVGLQQFNLPTGIDANGLNVFVADTQNRRIHRLDRRLNFLGVLSNDPGANDDLDSSFGFPRGVAVSPIGDIYISDTENEEVIKMNTAGRIEIRFGGFSYGDGRLHDPAGIAVDRSGLVYVADTGNDRIALFDPFGGFLKEIGGDTLKAPEGVDVDDLGRILVADTGNDRIVLFSAEGGMLLAFGAQGSGLGSFRRPRDVAAGPDDRLYVADTGNHRIQEFTLQTVERKEE